MPANVETMFYYGEKPWHGLGVELQEPATASEAIKAAGLDWQVSKNNLQLVGSGKVVTNHYAMVREGAGNVLGVVGDKYQPIQNSEAFSFFDSVVGSGQAIYHTAGALGKGEQVWVMAKLPGTIEVVKGDEVEKFLLLSNSHNGGMALRMLFTPIRVVCQNTLNAALGGTKGQGVTIRHSGDVMVKVREAQRVLGMAQQFYADFTEVSMALAKFKMTDSSLQAYYDEVQGVQIDQKSPTRARNVREELTRLFSEGKGHDKPGVRGTLWAALNAVAEYADYGRVPRSKSDEEKSSNRLESTWFGSGAWLKERAWESASALVA